MRVAVRISSCRASEDTAGDTFPVAPVHCLALPEPRHEARQLFIGHGRVMVDRAAFAAAAGQPQRVHGGRVDMVGPEQGAVVAENRLQPEAKLASAVAVPETIHHRLDVGGGDRGERPAGKLLRMVEERALPALYRLGVPPAGLVALDIGFRRLTERERILAFLGARILALGDQCPVLVRFPARFDQRHLVALAAAGRAEPGIFVPAALLPDEQPGARRSRRWTSR